LLSGAGLRSIAIIQHQASSSVSCDGSRTIRTRYGDPLSVSYAPAACLAALLATGSSGRPAFGGLTSSALQSGAAMTAPSRSRMKAAPDLPTASCDRNFESRVYSMMTLRTP
jgi:hypothetical protein